MTFLALSSLLFHLDLHLNRLVCILLHLLHFSLWNNVFLSVSVMKHASPGNYAVNL